MMNEPDIELASRLPSPRPWVGCLGSGYPQQRNILGSGSFGVTCHGVSDRLSILHRLWHRISGKGYSGVLHSFAWARDCEKVDLIHSFNALVLGGKPWVVTYETTLPRVGTLPAPLVRFGWQGFAHPRCLAILALSECAAERLREDLRVNRARVSEAVRDAIREKIAVLHPPQPVLIEGTEEKCRAFDWHGPLRLALVGHDFYRKGGFEVLLAMDELLLEGKDLQLSIAGKMTAGDYASHAGEVEVLQAEEIIARHPSRIHRLGSVPGEQVHELLRESHILCLPTWGDTYGYSVLEGQASGCAAVTTNLRALPEINNPDCGWVIAVPKLPNGDGDLDSAGKREKFRKILVEGLKAALREAHDDRVGLLRKAEAALKRVRRFHDPAAHAERLKEIYQQQLQ